MLRIHVVAAFILLLLPPALATAQDRAKPARRSTSGVEQTILQLEREIMDAIKNKDTAALSRVMAEDFIFRSAAGPDLNRGEFLGVVKSFPIKIEAIWGDTLKVKVYGQTAVLTGVQRARTARTDGREEISAGAFTDIFIRRKGRWLLVLAYNVDLPSVAQTPEPPPPSRK